MLRRLLLCSVLVWLGTLCFATAPAAAQAVKVNLVRRAFLDPIPFRSGFSLRGKIPERAEKVVVAYRPTGNVNADPTVTAPWVRPPAGYESADSFAIAIQALPPDLEYTFCIGIYGDSLPKAPSPAARDACDAEMVEKLSALGEPKLLARVRGTPRSSFKNHFDSDLGVMVSSEARYIGLVTSVHMQALPFNKSVDLMDHGSSMLEQLGARTSFFVGMSPIEIESNTEQDIKKTTPIGIPVVGIGFRGIFYWRNTGGFYSRFIQPIRLNAGVMFFEQDDANPLSNDDNGKSDVFLSLTADIELKDVLGPLAGLFGLK